MQAIITQRTQHSLPNFSGWYICPQWLSCSFGNSLSEQQEYLLSASSARWFVYCLSILGLFGYHPLCSQFSLCFANPKGFNSFSPGKYHCITFCTHCGFCQNLMHGGPKTSKSWNALQQGPLERYVVQPPYWGVPPSPPSCGIHLDQSR